MIIIMCFFAKYLVLWMFDVAIWQFSETTWNRNYLRVIKHTQCGRVAWLYKSVIEMTIIIIIKRHFMFYFSATEAHDDDGLPHTLEHLVFLGSEDYPFKAVAIFFSLVLTFIISMPRSCASRLISKLILSKIIDIDVIYIYPSISRVCYIFYFVDIRCLLFYVPVYYEYLNTMTKKHWIYHNQTSFLNLL